MTSKTFIRLMCLVIALTVSLMLFSASETNKTSPQDEACLCGKEKCDENQVGGDFLIWESISRHLLSTGK